MNHQQRYNRIATCLGLLSSWDVMHEALLTAMHKTINDHGPITKDMFSSFEKRVRGELKVIKNSEAQSLALEAASQETETA